MELLQDFTDITPDPKATAECRKALYSSDGSRFAYTQPDAVYVFNTSGKASLHTKVEVAEVMDIMFSPKGTYLVMWLKPILLDRELGKWSENVFVYNLHTLQVICKWSKNQQNGWKPQFTADESVLVKGHQGNKEIHFYEIDANVTQITLSQPSHKYKVNDPQATYNAFEVSPGKNPAIAIFIPEQGGKPALVCVYNIPSFKQPICLKNFFKAERCQLQWNTLGTALLALALIDHDTTNQLYYGETNLYLLGIAGSYDSRITLDKEGPIHDITWSPLAREFAVSYGFMPSLTTFFDARGSAIHLMPMAPRNTIRYSPHARYVLVAGFGNLQGTVDIYDRQNKFSKLVTFQAPNTSVCEWSPCGRFILTATTAPRLRVDNGLKVWHASGQLIYMKEYQELNQIGWKPQSIDSFPALRLLEPAPPAHLLAQEWLSKRAETQLTQTARPAGAYRPPHARRTGAPAATSSLYEKEQQSLRNAKVGVNPISGRPRVVPGAPITEPQELKQAAKNRKKRAAKKEREASSGSPTPQATPPPTQQAGLVVGGVISLEEKKIRSLLKKLRAIEVLKMKQANGEPLEDTQVSKINKEDDIRNELISLGWNDE